VAWAELGVLATALLAAIHLLGRCVLRMAAAAAHTALMAPVVVGANLKLVAQITSQVCQDLEVLHGRVETVQPRTLLAQQIATQFLAAVAALMADLRIVLVVLFTVATAATETKTAPLRVAAQAAQV
jgi:hypothetical protein